jgi:tetratricopeptide (TPR) repeat protein
MFAAAEKGHAKAAEALLDGGANANARGDVPLRTPLHLAAIAGHVETAKCLVAHEADVDAPEAGLGRTPLHLAAIAGHDEMAAYLRECGADESKKDIHGLTPERAAAILRERDKRELVAAADAGVPFDPRAVVRLVSFGLGDNGYGYGGALNAFAVGDGSLVVTAAHCAAAVTEPAEYGVLMKPLLASPHLGEIVEAEVIATNASKDIALLRAPWKDHPAFALATEEEMEAADELVVAAFPPGDDPCATPSMEVFTERLPVLKISKFGMMSPVQGIALGCAKFVGPGWSGSPVLIPDNGKVAGLIAFHHLHEIGEQVVEHRVWGAKVKSIRWLMRRNALAKEMEAEARPSTAPADAQAGFEAVFDWLMTLRWRDDDRGLKEAEHYVKLRPDSPYAHLFLGVSAHRQYVKKSYDEELKSLAERSFTKALELAPENILARGFRASLCLTAKNEKEALAEIEKVLAVEPKNLHARTIKLLALTEMKSEEAETVGRALTEEAPWNPHSWFLLAGALRALEMHEEAVKAAREAVDRDPCNVSMYHGRLADTWAKSGRVDLAEAYLKQRMEESPDSPYWWFCLASILADHCPDRIDEARAALAKAESMEGSGSWSHRALDELREKLRAAEHPRTDDVPTTTIAAGTD